MFYNHSFITMFLSMQSFLHLKYLLKSLENQQLILGIRLTHALNLMHLRHLYGVEDFKWLSYVCSI